VSGNVSNFGLFFRQELKAGSIIENMWVAFYCSLLKSRMTDSPRIIELVFLHIFNKLKACKYANQELIKGQNPAPDSHKIKIKLY
jgi:hypothetical protein